MPLSVAALVTWRAIPDDEYETRHKTAVLGGKSVFTRPLPFAAYQLVFVTSGLMDIRDLPRVKESVLPRAEGHSDLQRDAIASMSVVRHARLTAVIDSGTRRTHTSFV